MTTTSIYKAGIPATYGTKTAGSLNVNSVVALPGTTTGVGTVPAQTGIAVNTGGANSANGSTQYSPQPRNTPQS